MYYEKEDLFDTLGDINNQYIKEAHMNNKRKIILHGLSGEQSQHALPYWFYVFLW